MDHPARVSDAIICNTLGSATVEVDVLWATCSVSTTGTTVTASGSLFENSIRRLI